MDNCAHRRSRSACAHNDTIYQKMRLSGTGPRQSIVCVLVAILYENGYLHFVGNIRNMAQCKKMQFDGLVLTISIPYNILTT